MPASGSLTVPSAQATTTNDFTKFFSDGVMAEHDTPGAIWGGTRRVRRWGTGGASAAICGFLRVIIRCFVDAERRLLWRVLASGSAVLGAPQPLHTPLACAIDGSWPAWQLDTDEADCDAQFQKGIAQDLKFERSSLAFERQWTDK